MAKKLWIKKGADGLSFGERLGDLISNNKITATTLARNTGIPQSRISDYLNKDSAPDCGTICTLAKYFSVSTDYLLGLTDIKTPHANIQAAVQLTGLTEESVQKLSLFSQLSIPFADCIDDLIEITTQETVLVEYILLLKALEVPAPTPLTPTAESSGASLLNSARNRENGYVLLTGEESFDFYCNRFASHIKEGMVKKHISSAQWRKQNGNN